MKFYSALEISKAVPCNYARVLKAIQAGDLPALTQGGVYLVNESDAELYIQQARVSTDPQYVLDLEAQVARLKEQLQRLGVAA